MLTLTAASSNTASGCLTLHTHSSRYGPPLPLAPALSAQRCRPPAHLGFAALAAKLVLQQWSWWGCVVGPAVPLQQALPTVNGLLDVVIHTQGSPVGMLCE